MEITHQLSFKEQIKVLEYNGWKKVRCRSSHITFKKNGVEKIITLSENTKSMVIFRKYNRLYGFAEPQKL